MMVGEESGMRATIIEKAKSLFIEHGYLGLSMREIAEKVGVSKPALYYHFKDKEELFYAVLSSGLEEIGRMIHSINNQPVSSYKKISLFMEYVLTQPTEQRAFIRLGTQEITQLSPASRQLFAESYRQQFTERLRAMIQTGIENGEFREMDTDIATWGLLGLLYPYLYPNHFGLYSLSAEKIELIISMYMKGIQKS